MKINTIIGARPQFVKAAIVSRALRDHRTNVQEVLIHTGQHYDANMSAIFFDELDIPPPHYNLGIGGGSHGENTGRMIERIERVLLDEMPDWVLVYGDTDSTLAGAIAAAKLNIAVAHIEAGLRSFNRRMPEEINRVLTDHTSTLLFTPTPTATANLSSEGIIGNGVREVGDVMYDAAIFYGEAAQRRSAILERLALQSHRYVLTTIHRQENADDRERLRAILAGFAESPLPVIWPIHPRTQKRIGEFGLDIPPHVRLIDPLGYLDMAMLAKNACLIATDSGGLQKEAYFHGVPCLTLREETEWVELVQAGWNELIRIGDPAIAKSWLRDAIEHCDPLRAHPDLYGDGTAARQIACML